MGSARPAPGHRTAAPAIALTLLLVILSVDLGSLLVAARVIIPFPYNIDYGEGIVWQQMLNMVAGHGYAPIGVFPAIVYHYPPVYHLTVAALAALSGGDPLAVGRLVSLMATLGSCLIVGLIAHRGLLALARPKTAIAGAAFAALLFPACQPVAEWASLMRVDMLATLFSLAGLLLALKALRDPRLIHVAALCFVLGVYTKQVAIAAPAAAVLGLLLSRPALAWRCLATSVALGLTALAALTIVTDGGFLRHIILYNINRNEAHRLWMLLNPLRAHAIFLILAAIGARSALKAIRTFAHADERRATLLILLFFFAFKTLMLAMIVKSGGSTNYMIEWFAPLAIFAGIGAAPAMTMALGTPTNIRRTTLATPTVATALLGAAALQAVPLVHWGISTNAAATRSIELDRLVAAIRRDPSPVIADDMTLLIRAGKPVMWEPSIVAELASVGRYDEPRFVAMIRAHCFGGFVTDGNRGDQVFDSRYNPSVAAAMDAGYPRRFDYARLTLHLPPRGAMLRRCGTVD